MHNMFIYTCILLSELYGVARRMSTGFTYLQKIFNLHSHCNTYNNTNTDVSVTLLIFANTTHTRD